VDDMHNFNFTLSLETSFIHILMVNSYEENRYCDSEFKYPQGGIQLHTSKTVMVRMSSCIDKGGVQGKIVMVITNSYNTTTTTVNRRDLWHTYCFRHHGPESNT